MDQDNRRSSVVFESEEVQPSRRTFQTKTPKMVQWVIKHSGGMVKDEKQANYVLIGFVVVMVVVTALLLTIFGGSDVKGPIPEGTSITVPG